MGSLAVPPSAAPDAAPKADATARPPELSEAEYVRDVLSQPAGRSEADVDEELIALAAGLGIDPPVSRPSTPEKPATSSAGSAATATTTTHHRSNSTASNASASTGLTLQLSASAPPPATSEPPAVLLPRKRSKSLNFGQYERYLSQVDPNLQQPKFHALPPPKTERAGSIFSVSTRRSVKEFRRGISTKLKWRKKPPLHPEDTIACICCREDFVKDEQQTQTLPCGHTYCHNCLAVIIKQSTTDESKMPPRCCTQPIPGSTIKTVLARDEQHAFLKAVLQYSTPWESRIFCPNTSCGEFVPLRSRIDPKHPFEATCRTCRTRVCIMCKRNAHRFGQDCPEDWELDAVLKMGEKSGWRRCYKCRTLVELTQGCTHMTCRCKAQFCYICGAVWDPVVGCPNFCNGEEELERRRIEEAARMAELEAEKEAQDAAAAAEETERLEAELRTKNSPDFDVLRAAQEAELTRFQTFERKMKWIMWTRHSQKKLALVDRHSDQMEKMRERHAKTEQHLEDRQIEAEIELRQTLDQSEKSIRTRLKYMEAYCNGLGRYADTRMPEREVTQRHLEQLGQQYHIRDGMERRHQAQINVLREKQAKRMEELTERQEKELETLEDKRSEELENLSLEFGDEEEALARVFEERKARLRTRWRLNVEIMRKELEKRDGVKYGAMRLTPWPAEREIQDENLAAVEEEDDGSSAALDA